MDIQLGALCLILGMLNLIIALGLSEIGKQLRNISTELWKINNKK